MPTELLRDLEVADSVEEVTAPELEIAAGYTVKSDVRAGAPASGSCPSSYASQKYRGDTYCVPMSPC